MNYFSPKKYFVSIRGSYETRNHIPKTSYESQAHPIVADNYLTTPELNFIRGLANGEITKINLKTNESLNDLKRSIFSELNSRIRRAENTEIRNYVLRLKKEMRQFFDNADFRISNATQKTKKQSRGMMDMYEPEVYTKEDYEKARKWVEKQKRKMIQQKQTGSHLQYRNYDDGNWHEHPHFPGVQTRTIQNGNSIRQESIAGSIRMIQNGNQGDQFINNIEK